MKNVLSGTMDLKADLATEINSPRRYQLLRRKIVSMEEVAAKIAADKAAKEVEAEPEVVFCSIDNPECEACQ